jgi:hypothetical protein
MTWWGVQVVGSHLWGGRFEVAGIAEGDYKKVDGSGPTDRRAASDGLEH